MSYKDDFKNKNYELIFSELHEKYKDNINEMNTWYYYYYSYSGIELGKKEITLDSIKNYVDNYDLKKDNEIGLRGLNFIKLNYVKLLKNDFDHKISDNPSLYRQCLDSLEEAANFLTESNGTLIPSYFFENMFFNIANKILNNNTHIELFERMLSMFNRVDDSYFSRDTYTTFDKIKGRSIIHASKQEKYFVLKIKLLYKLKKHEEIILVSDIALSTIDIFHDQNDITIIRRKAIALKDLNKFEEAKELLKTLLKKKNDWFIFYDLANIYKAENDNENTLICYLKSFLSYSGDYYGKINVINNLANILENNMPQLSKHLFAFEYNLRTEKKWNISEELAAKQDASINVNIRKITNEVFDLLYENDKSLIGTITKLFPSGKDGFIGEYYFNVKNFNGKREWIVLNTKVRFIITESFNKKGEPSKEAIFIKRIDS
jgi:tetratricopeptide (TPR) repeat protein